MESVGHPGDNIPMPIYSENVLWKESIRHRADNIPIPLRSEIIIPKLIEKSHSHLLLTTKRSLYNLISYYVYIILSEVCKNVPFLKTCLYSKKCLFECIITFAFSWVYVFCIFFVKFEYICKISVCKHFWSENNQKPPFYSWYHRGLKIGSQGIAKNDGLQFAILNSYESYKQNVKWNLCKEWRNIAELILGDFTQWKRGSRGQKNNRQNFQKCRHNRRERNIQVF